MKPKYLLISSILVSLCFSFTVISPKQAFACDSSKDEKECNCAGSYSCKKNWESCGCTVQVNPNNPPATQAPSNNNTGTKSTPTPTAAPSNNVPAGQKCESWCGSCGYTFIACGSYCPTSSQCGSAGQTDLRQTNGGSPNENQTTNNDPTVIIDGKPVKVTQPGQIAGGVTPTPTNATNNNSGSSGACDSGSNRYCIGQGFGSVVNLSQVSGVGDPWCCYRTGSTNSCNLNRCGCLYNSQADCQQCVRDPNNPSKCTSTTRTCSLGATTGCWTPSSGGSTINIDCLTKVQCEKYGDKCGAVTANNKTCYEPVSVPGVAITSKCDNISSYQTQATCPKDCTWTPSTGKCSGNTTSESPSSDMACYKSAGECQLAHPGMPCTQGSNGCFNASGSIVTALDTCIGGEAACGGHTKGSNCGGSNVCRDLGMVTINRVVGRNCICRDPAWDFGASTTDCLQADQSCTGHKTGQSCSGSGNNPTCQSQGIVNLNGHVGNSCICRDPSWTPDYNSCTSGDSMCIGKTQGSECNGTNTACKGLASMSTASKQGNACVCQDKNWTQGSADCLTQSQCADRGDPCVEDQFKHGCYVPVGSANATTPTINCASKSTNSNDCASVPGCKFEGGKCTGGVVPYVPSATPTSGSEIGTPWSGSITCGNVSGQTLGNRCAGGGVYTSGGTNKNGSQICICTPPGGSTGDGSGVTTTGNCGGSGQNCCDPFSQNGKICNNGLYCNTTTGKCQNTPPTNLCQGGGSGGTPSTQCAVFKCGNSCNNGNQCTVNRSVVPCDQADVALGSQCGQIDFLDTNGAYCGVKNQHCGGSCTGTTNPTGNPTGTNPPSNPSGTTNPVPVCVEVNMYYKSGDNWVKTAVADIANHVHVGDEIRFSVVGRSGSFAKARFHIKIDNGAWGDWIETTGKLANASGAEYYINYTVPAGKISVEGQLF